MLLRAQNLSRKYGHGDAAVIALKDASFDVADGEFVAIMGPSGSGKSTLMNLIGLLDRPTNGTLLFAGENTSRLAADRLAALRNRQIGFVFQACNLLARNTAVENVEMPLVYAGVRRSDRKLRARAALERVGLGHRLEHWPNEMSGGEQQRVAIARALVGDPALILADEPTGALDSRTGLNIMSLLQEINRGGRTIIVVTHDESVAHYAGRVLRLKDGSIVSDERNEPGRPAQMSIHAEPALMDVATI